MNIVVVGGGVVGSALASLAALEGINVTLIDAGLQTPKAPLIYSKLLKYESDVELACISEYVYNRLSEAFKVRLMRKYDTLIVLPPDCYERRVKGLVRPWVKRGIIVEHLGPNDLEKFGLKRVLKDEIVLLCKNADGLVDVREIVRRTPYLKNVKLVKCQADLRIDEKAKAVCDGRVFEGDYVILACGAWNAAMARRLGLKLPLLPYKCQAYAYLWPNRRKFILYDYVTGIYARPLGDWRDGVLGAFGFSIVICGDGNSPIEEPIGCPDVDDEFKVELTEKVKRRFGWALPIAGRAGYCEGTPDTLPIVGHLSDRLIVIGGFDGYGAEVGPALALGVVRFLKEGSWPNFVRPYLIDRFREWPESWDVNREAHDLCVE